MKTKQRKVFERVVNPLILKHMIDPFKYQGSCIASCIPIKYLKYFKMVSAQKNAKKIRYRYRGVSKTMPNGYMYNRPQSFCHMNFADTFAWFSLASI